MFDSYLKLQETFTSFNGQKRHVEMLKEDLEKKEEQSALFGVGQKTNDEIEYLLGNLKIIEDLKTVITQAEKDIDATLGDISYQLNNYLSTSDGTEKSAVVSYQGDSYRITQIHYTKDSQELEIKKL